ncbi:hypothetical protein OEZ85_013036 [Tetradesmus obliquus]|uniref:Suppressor of forked domain-containing protein n=1 Tax=Tetradesmus obliquus TaxID=3088 RepID=A0ABY8U7F2_TETOB|nr:hypothetical protein OEZ85_013036 [Tetradesmus obliquus]
MYEHALELSRLEQYDEARQAFQQLLSNDPTFCRGWVSFAQMERRAARTQDPERLAVARAILQRGLQINPGSGCLAQAWGLLELQKGNAWAAVRLLERCVEMDSALEPVLRWKPVNAARLTAAGAAASRGRPWPRSSSSSSGGSRVGQPGARVACASTAGGGGSAGGGVGGGGTCSSGVGGAGGALSHDGQGSSCMSSM